MAFPSVHVHAMHTDLVLWPGRVATSAGLFGTCLKALSLQVYPVFYLQLVCQQFTPCFLQEENYKESKSSALFSKPRYANHMYDLWENIHSFYVFADRAGVQN